KRKGIEKITILEKNPACGMEASNAAAGMLAPQSEADRDDSFFRFCSESRDLYPQFAEEILCETGVDIELDRAGTLYLASNEKDAAELEKRYLWQKAANLSIEKLSAREILEIEPNISRKVLFGLSFPNDWQVENRKIIEALDLQLKKHGENQTESRVQIINGEVGALIFENNKVIGAKTNHGKFFAEKIIIASGAWTSLIKDRFDLLSSVKVKPLRGQMLEFSEKTNLFRRVVYTPRGYIVPRKNGRILVGATVEDAGFDCRVTLAGTDDLLEKAIEISPRFANLNLKNSWAGLRPFAPDGLPVLGEFPGIENLYAATAHYRNGILLAPKTSEILADKITGGEDSEYLKIFSPLRFAAAGAF
ncbi:MAG: glycine oxidase ThiO, partial [Pyrinomonadaceae bacterium]